MKPLVVVGGGGFGREVLDVIAAINAVEPEWDVLGVLDNGPSELALERLAARKIAHLGGLDWLAHKPPLHVVIAVGDPGSRARLVQQVEDFGPTATTLIHPSATIGSMSEVGNGSVVCAGAQISTNVRLGQHVHINPNVTIGHDSRLGDLVSINPGAIVSGDVSIESGCLVGAGAVILQQLRVGPRAVIGAAACVTRDVLPQTTVKGVPARATSANEER